MKQCNNWYNQYRVIIPLREIEIKERLSIKLDHFEMRAISKTLVSNCGYAFVRVFNCLNNVLYILNKLRHSKRAP